MRIRRTASEFPVPRGWFFLSLLTILFWGSWGVESKLIVEKISPWMNQLLFPLGLIPVLLWALLSPRRHVGNGQAKGVAAAVLTGVLAAAGNIAFYLALAAGGKASIVTPLTCLFPLITVLMAYLMLRERVTSVQVLGMIVALVSIYLLSV